LRIVVSSVVRDCLAQRQLREHAHRRDLVERLFHRRIGKPEPVLHQVDPQYLLQRVGMPTTSRQRIDRLDQLKQRLPGDHQLHLGQEQLSPRLLALAGVLGIPKTYLFHRSLRLVTA